MRVCNKSDVLVQQVVRRVYERPVEELAELNVNSLAMSLGVTQPHLSRVFKAEKGICLKDYIETQKMERVAELLTGSSLSVSEIARLLDYSSGGYLARVFRRQFGKTPKQYRVDYHESRKIKAAPPKLVTVSKPVATRKDVSWWWELLKDICRELLRPFRE